MSDNDWTLVHHDENHGTMTLTRQAVYPTGEPVFIVDQDHPMWCGEGRHHTDTVSSMVTVHSLN